MRQQSLWKNNPRKLLLTKMHAQVVFRDLSIGMRAERFHDRSGWRVFSPYRILSALNSKGVKLPPAKPDAYLTELIHFLKKNLTDCSLNS
jgi:hypothetical protein